MWRVDTVDTVDTVHPTHSPEQGWAGRVFAFKQVANVETCLGFSLGFR